MKIEHISVSSEVENAISNNLPLVALESTIISHGMPFPRNLETAEQVEDLIRQQGAVPATIAVVDGKLRVGLDEGSLKTLANDKNVMKLSRSNLHLAISEGLTGSTTVSATMMAAHAAGIVIMATGGIGGVHQGAESSFDISADIDELGKTPVAVVAAGAKALLDLPKTLEALETRGVPVVGYQTDDFPAFWSRSCGLPVPIRLNTAEQISNLIRVRRDFSGCGGILVANPVPESEEIPYSEITNHIQNAVAAAEENCIRGSDYTPHVLSSIEKSTKGRSLETNVSLIKNNALLAAQIAISEKF